MADSPKTTFSRRGFLKGAGVTAATTVIETANALARDAKDAVHHDRVVGPDALPVKLHINGHEHSVVIEPRDTLAADPARQPGADRNQGRLRSRLMFGVHGLDGQDARACLHDAGDRYRRAARSPPSRACLTATRCIPFRRPL